MSSGLMGVRRRGLMGKGAKEGSNCIVDPKEYSFDDFEIVKTIGTGTFGRVSLCKEKMTGQFFALKTLAIADVIKLKQVDHVKNEKNILQFVTHPFIIKMHWHYRDDKFLYMLFDYVCGGELFSYLRSSGQFPLTTATFYAAEIVMALDYLHSLSIAYRDLKPENLLLDRLGHLKITDFGFAKKLTDRTWTLCGTPEYLAPEIIQSKGHNGAVDWWALGILIYEMLAGYPPFFDDNPFGIYEKILAGRVDYPKHLEGSAKDLIKRLLTHDRTKRIGNMKNGAEDVKRHRFFKATNWDDVFQKRIPVSVGIIPNDAEEPPIVPKVSFEGDTRNFDEYPDGNSNAAASVSQADLHIFSDF